MLVRTLEVAVELRPVDLSGSWMGASARGERNSPDPYYGLVDLTLREGLTPDIMFKRLR